MTEECTLNIVKNGEFNNINLSEMKNDSFIVIKKLFNEGLEKTASKGNRSWSYFIVKAEYKGQEVSFIMNERTHKEYKELGGIGDQIKLIYTKSIADGTKKDGTKYEFVKKDWKLELV